MPRLPALFNRKLNSSSLISFSTRLSTSKYYLQAQCRQLSVAQPLNAPKALPARPPLLPESEIESKALHGSGPGGQKINKTSSAIQLKHLPTGIVVKCQATRSRRQNMKLAQRLLADEVDVFRNGSQSRREVVRGIIGDKKRSAEKKRKRKYKRLAEERQMAEDEGEEADENDIGEDEIEALNQELHWTSLDGKDAHAAQHKSPDSFSTLKTASKPEQHTQQPSTPSDGNVDILKQFYSELEKRKSGSKDR